ncbi:MAG: hypothetical protein HY099_06300 [Nitrospirae bacterium]|nr:hypothetical protein [Nitrospirota bacterium]
MRFPLNRKRMHATITAISIACFFLSMLFVTARAAEYASSSMCRGCHPNIFDQHVQSMHEKSFANPVFQAQYFNELLPAAAKDPELLKEAEACTACHTPVTFITLKGHMTSRDQVNQRMSGVTCDFCHTIKGYAGESPGNGNFVSEPSDTKLGPFVSASNWHRSYSELHTKSEFCAICHNAVNRHSIEIKSTYTEWKDSRYAKEGIQCQDCHMNAKGFLTGGRPVYESGEAALMSGVQTPRRERLYTHQFPGAHSKTQVVGALTLTVETGRVNASPGNETTVNVLVNNSRTGHKFPSGSADIRLLWLDIKAYAGDKPVPVTVSDAGADTYGLTGKGAFDQEILGNDIPDGKRIYRAVFIDKKGKQTLSSYNAAKIVFDNRLNADEVRKEVYHIKIPEDAPKTLSIVVTLRYLSYPSSFSDKLGLPKPEPVEIASAKKDIALN